MSESTADFSVEEEDAGSVVPMHVEDTTEAVAEPGVEPVSEAPKEAAEASAESADEAVDEPAEVAAADPLEAVQQTLTALLAESAKYHQRAQQREGVIDTLHAEVETLRRGERQTQMRPVVTAIARTREDLLRQADQLPDDFDAASARSLLMSFADELEVVLADNGVTSESPTTGERVDPRVHRVAGKTETSDLDLVGTIAAVRRNGYRDLDTEKQIAPAEVIAYVAAAAAVVKPAAEIAEEPVAPVEPMSPPAESPAATLPAESDERQNHDD